MPTTILAICLLLNIYKLLKHYNLVEAAIHPIVIVSAYLFVFFVVPAHSDELYVPLTFRSTISFSQEQLLYTIWLVTSAYVSITLYFQLKKQKRDNLQEKAEQKNYKRFGITLETYILLYCLFICLIILRLVMRFGGFIRILYNFPEFYLMARSGSTALLLILYSVISLPAIYLMFSNKPRKSFFAFLFLFVIFVSGLTGARMLIVVVLMQVYLMMLIRRQVTLRRTFIISLLFVLLFVATSWTRSAKEVTKVSSFGKDLTSYWTRNADQLVNTLLVVRAIENEEITFQKGKTLIDAAYFLMPSKLFPNKPRSYYPSRLFYKTAATSTGQSFNFGMIGRSYLDFGPLGVILLNIIVFAILLKIFEFLISKKYQKDLRFSFRDFILLYIYSNILLFYILGVLSHVPSYFLLNTICWGGFFIGHRIFDCFIKEAVINCRAALQKSRLKDKGIIGE